MCEARGKAEQSRRGFALHQYQPRSAVRCPIFPKVAAPLLSRSGIIQECLNGRAWLKLFDLVLGLALREGQQFGLQRRQESCPTQRVLTLAGAHPFTVSATSD
jgi:hypothetical protein